jgi:hypothetical protein
VVIVANSRLPISASIARRYAGVARKIEQLLAEWRDIRSLVEIISTFVFLNALFKNSVDLVCWLADTLSEMARSLHIGAHFGIVGAHVGR